MNFSSMNEGKALDSKLISAFPPPQRTLPVMLQRQALLFGDRTLLTFDDHTISYREACAIAARSAAALHQAGVRPGDRVALLCSNRVEFLQLYLGCAWAGVIAVPINVASRGAQLRHILDNCGARLIAIEADLVHVLEPLDRAGLALEKVWLIGNGRSVTLPDLQVAPFVLGNEAADPHQSQPGDTVAILYTSGTTGLSKGVCCPQAQYFWWGVHTASLLEMREGDVLYSCLPLFHTNALNSFYQALLTGSTLVVGQRFSVSGYTAALKRHGATISYLLGAMVPMLLSRPPSDDERAHKTRIALAPGVPVQFREIFQKRFGIGLIDGYGSTETNFTIGATLADQRPGFMGRVRPGFQAKVVDEHDNEVPDGTPGELIMRADEPFAFATGYFGMADKTVEAWRNLWFHSGDRVIREACGGFRFLDRMKDAIRRRGENISSFEVEQVITSHPAVANAAVFPVQSELAEDEVMVAVVLQEKARLTPEELLDYCQPRMPYFAVPRYVDFATALPTTENGKVQKYKLRDKGVGEATWDREAAGYVVKR
ncbi:ATP-dependent acyl-CoA ligase [Limoniibacter endophyticus]|uniref:ATP-dependent acyl-CoA ligase n=1 Tax=Limoniibacter endophyticus TaxID=1565040 RepID=A0A8J3DJ16_9HYPH|nr:ATP-dependent acyl-CoA ligase [Limoniibacter endophyticus]GHC72178.1 ATP-dependent acyl-CoA ligase [Limoniibacter endophyticus]